MKVLIEFKAGKMNLVDRQLVADSRKGKLQLVEDLYGLHRLQWGPETETGYQIEDNVTIGRAVESESLRAEIQRQVQHSLLLVRESSSFSTPAMPIPSGRIQEGDSGEDESRCLSINQLINRQSNLRSEFLSNKDWTAAGFLSGAPSNPQGSSSSNTMGVPNPSTLAQILGNMISSGSSSQGTTGTPPQSNQAALAAALLSSAFGGAANAAFKRSGPSLAQILQPEVFAKYLQDPDMLERLAEFLPESQRTQEDLINQCTSPQLHQQLLTFSHTLQTGQFDPAALGLEVEGYSAIDFLNAIQKLVDKEKSKQQ